MIIYTGDEESKTAVRLVFAPMEGITTAAFRRAHREVFGGADRYYTPFLNTGRVFLKRTRDRRDLEPGMNQGVALIPQLLSNNSTDFLAAVERLANMGFTEINLNLGCPSPTVVSRHRGAGFLEDTDALDDFFCEVFGGLPEVSRRCGVSPGISVKTRIGLRDPEEAAGLIEVYNRYPLSALIIHPRVQKEGYSGEVHTDVFAEMFRESRNPVYYNGDILTPDDAQRIAREYRDTDGGGRPLAGIMIGRGAVRDPALFREIRGGEPCSRAELEHFLALVLRYTAEGIPEENNQLMKMKDLWAFLGLSFPQGKKQLKAIRHADSLHAYHEAVRSLLDTWDGGQEHT